MDSARVVHGGLVARNTLLNLVGQGLPLIVAVATMPYVIRGLGPERFGILALSWVVLSYLGFFNLGLGRAATKYVAEELGRGGESSVQAITWTVVLAQTALGILAGLVLVLLTPVLVTRILNIAEGYQEEAILTFYLLAPSVPFVLVTSSFRGVLEAAQRFDLVNAVRVPFSAANFVFPVVGVMLGWSLPGIVGLLVISRIVALVVHYRLCVAVFPSLKGAPRPEAVRLRELLTFGGWVTVSSLVGPILLNLDKFIIGAVITMSAVTYYTAPYEIVTRLWILPTSLVAALFPAFSTLQGSNQPEAFGTLWARSTRHLLFFLGLGIVAVIALAPDILKVWLGSDFVENSTLVLQILALAVLVNSLAQIPYSIIQAVGRPDLTAKFHLAELPVHVILTIVLVSMWGIPGAALAWALRAALDALLMVLAARSLTSTTFRHFLAEGVPQTALLLLAFGILAALIVEAVTPPGLRVPLVGVSLVAACGIVWVWLFDEGDRARLVRFVRARSVRR